MFVEGRDFGFAPAPSLNFTKQTSQSIVILSEADRETIRAVEKPAVFRARARPWFRRLRLL
jgi:hypothetical protein